MKPSIFPNNTRQSHKITDCSSWDNADCHNNENMKNKEVDICMNYVHVCKLFLSPHVQGE